MAMLSKALPLTASYLSPLPRIEHAGASEETARDLGLGGVRYSTVLRELKLASCDRNMAEKVTKNKKSLDALYHTFFNLNMCSTCMLIEALCIQHWNENAIISI